MERCAWPTFERLIKLVFAKDDSQVVNCAGVELHPENHVPARAAIALVVAFELREESHRMRSLLREEYNQEIIM